MRVKVVQNWFKYPKSPLLWDVNTPQERTTPRIIFNSGKRNNCSSFTQSGSGTTGPHKTDKFGFIRWVEYWGIFYFFIKYLKIKGQHYETDIKPIFIKWSKIIPQPLGYHESSTIFDPLNITVVDTTRALDHDGMATTHLIGYPKEYELLLFITNLHNKYRNDFFEFRSSMINQIQNHIAVSIPAISYYDEELPQATNYYFLFNIRRYLWDKFWEKKPEVKLEIAKNGDLFELIQIPGRRRISLGENRMDLEKLKQYIEDITDEIVYALLSFEVDRECLHKLVSEFSEKIYSIERDIRWNKGLKGRCGWERNFWGRWDIFNRPDPTVNTDS